MGWSVCSIARSAAIFNLLPSISNLVFLACPAVGFLAWWGERLMIPVPIMIVKRMAIPPGTLERQGNQALFTAKKPFGTESQSVHRISLVGECSIGKVLVGLLYHVLDRLLYRRFVSAVVI